MKRKEIENHLRNECDFRPYQCEHCGFKDTYRAIAGGLGEYSAIDCHYDKCLEFPLECPNKCGVKDIKRKDMEDHRGRCPEEKVQCPNECEPLSIKHSQFSVFVIKRKDLENHLANECSLRPYQCEHCGYADTYEAITGEENVYSTIECHYDVCPEFPLECPNNCKLKDIKRKDMKDHRSQCPEEPVQCPFEEAGCKEKLVRRELEQHMLTTQQQHLLMVMGAYKEVKKANKEIQTENEHMKEAHKEIKQAYAKLEDAYKEIKQELDDVKQKLKNT